MFSQSHRTVLRSQHAMLRSNRFASALKAHIQAIRGFATAADVNKINVVFGSQTGTAMAFAYDAVDALEEAVRDGKTRFATSTEVAVLDAVEADPSKLFVEDAFNILILACYGQGEPTDNAKKLYKWMVTEMPASVPGSFAVFGLGSSKTHCEFYNVVGTRTDEALAKAGCKREMPMGYGDDSDSIDMDFENWLADLLATLNADTAAGTTQEEVLTEAANPVHTRHFPPVTSLGINERVYPPVDVAFDAVGTVRARKASSSAQPTAVERILSAAPSPKLFHLSPYAIQHVRILNPEMPLSDALCDVRLVRHTTSHQPAGTASPAYRTGDHFEMYAPNDTATASRLLERLDVATESGESLDKNALLWELTYTRDIDGPVTPKLLRSLMPYCTAASESAEAIKQQHANMDWLDLTAADKELFLARIRRPARRVLDLMEELFIERVPAQVFLKALPAQRPRIYSVASAAPTATGDIVDLCVRHVQFPRSTSADRPDASSPPLGEFEGVLSGFMRCVHTELTTGGRDQVPVFGAPLVSNFYLPGEGDTPKAKAEDIDPTAPVIMIAGGVGIAPFRAFLQQLIRRAKMKDPCMPRDTCLVYGARTPADFGYLDLLQEALDLGILRRDSVKLTYGQARGFSLSDRPLSELMMQGTVIDGVRALNKEVGECIGEGGYVYVCGGASGFGKAVHQVVRDAVGGSAKCGGPDAADDVVGQMLRAGRYLEDLSD